MATFKKFEEIKAWESARQLTVAVYAITRQGEFARDFGSRDQIQRAVVSIGSNIAEGFERNGNKEFIKFLYYAKGSAGEVQSQLYAAKGLGYIDSDCFTELYDAARRIADMIGALIKSMRESAYQGSRYLKPANRNP
jgi:four helix bundle protein